MTLQNSLLTVCLKCGSECCKYGSPMVLSKEREKIIEFCGKDHFEKKEDYYFIPKSPCPYLSKDNLCSIEKCKPFDCATYPVGIFKRDGRITIGISQKCHVKSILSTEFIEESKKILNNLSNKQKENLANLNENYEFEFKELL